MGTSKAAKAGGVAAIGPEDNEVNQQRRRFAWAMIAAFLTAWFIAFFRFFLPRTLFEPATTFKIGYPVGLRIGCGYEVAAEVPHLGGSHARSALCDLRALYALRMHA